ncbi:MAG: HAMP domain-containing protein [Zoogloeaceae bacterium]|jgi:nitrogen fixation/metabolism regulation signal transduction histidine kinase|nr:HAMP domain-containing protein [Zoogloeaceae bacterium]
MRRILAVLATLGGIFGILLWSFLMRASTSAGTLSGQYPLILAANLLLVLTLLALVGWQMYRLWRDLRDKVFGSRLKLRLMLMFGLVAVIPGALMYGVSVQFITRSIESWFDVRVEKALESGLDLGRSSLDYLQGELLQKAHGMARDLAAGATPDGRLRSRISRLREQSAVDSVALFAPNGQLMVSAQSDLSRPLPPLPSISELKQARASAQALSIIDNLDTGHLQLRILIAIAPKNFFEPPQVLQLAQNVPESLSANAEAVQAVHRDYQELQLAREGLTRIYALSLTLTVLVAIFSAFALAFVLARRLSAPLSILVEGTQAVAQGDYSPRQAVKTHDELGVLTQSFNRMTRQLDEARRETERHRNEVEAARAWLESILANLSAGVLVFDRHATLRTINVGAVNILGTSSKTLIDQGAAEWRDAFSALGQAIHAHFADNAREWQEQFVQDEAGGQKKILLLRGAPLPAMSGGGHVVVFDDVTQLINAQRSAAWGEVARRLAHEIKNPLTPIQLSAERLQLKLTDHLEGRARELLERSTQTIINQVLAMKRMVDDFRDYSQRATPRFAALDLNALIREVLALYEHSRMTITAELACDLPPVAGDANQLRQIIHNLLKNGEDALESIAAPRLCIQTEKADARFIHLRISDNGEGFPPEMLARVFEPYVTTKPRGTGLGLPIVKKIVEEHRGGIDIQNLAQGGASIRIRLPIAAQDTPAPQEKENDNG